MSHEYSKIIYFSQALVSFQFVVNSKQQSRANILPGKERPLHPRAITPRQMARPSIFHPNLNNLDSMLLLSSYVCIYIYK